MTDQVIRPGYMGRPRARARRPRDKGRGLYPLQWPLLFTGIAIALVVLMFLDWSSALSIVVLFGIVGAVWRADMLPVLPACLAYQWLSIASGYITYQITGEFPGGGYFGEFQRTLLYSLAGLAAVAAGLRVTLHLFEKQITTLTRTPPRRYNLSKVFGLTLAAFAISYVYDLAPRQIWFGGAQIIENLLALRFVPYFLLVVTVFERRKGYPFLLAGTAWVIGPQLLTGFSDFKELFLVIVIGALFQWRPWVRTREQARINRQVMAYGAIGATVAIAACLVWSGGLKQEWRDRIWDGDTAIVSPTARMGQFFEVAGDVATNIDVSKAAETQLGRASSSERFFSYVIERVPSTVAHENGALIGRALLNAIQPRFLFPNKADLGGDSWLVQKYAGALTAGNAQGASIGLGYMAEFYIDFGVYGVVGLSFVWGMTMAMAMIVLTKAAPSREIYMALIVGLCTAYLMPFGGSFIKLFGGLAQRTIIAGVMFWFIGRPLLRWLELKAPRAMAPRRPAPGPRVRGV